MILAEQNIFQAARETLRGKYYADACVTLNARTAPVALAPHTISHLVFLIEGFHDAVRTPYALRPGRHVGFFWNNKRCFNFVSILFEKIKLTVSERTYIIVPMV